MLCMTRVSRSGVICRGPSSLIQRRMYGLLVGSEWANVLRYADRKPSYDGLKFPTAKLEGTLPKLEVNGVNQERDVYVSK